MGCATSVPDVQDHSGPDGRGFHSAPPSSPSGGPARRSRRHDDVAPAPPSLDVALERFHSTFPPITESELVVRRCEFWDTRLEGHLSCWQALRMAVELNDEQTSAVIMESAGLTSWTLETYDGLICYDTTGKKYEVPLWILFNPSKLISEHQPSAASVPSHIDDLPPPYSPAPSAPPISLKIRFMSGGDLDLSIAPDSTGLALKQLIASQRDAPVDRQKLICAGNILQDAGVLRASGINEGSVIQVMLRPAGF